MTKELLKGNEAFAEAAVRAGCEGFFGYPITPSTEFLEYMSRRMPELDRAYVQAESEVAAINMVYGAACTGKRVMTASSSPGISLMSEGFSYIAGTEVPAVIVNVMRGGPGLGNIAPSQEAIDQIGLAFDLAEKYRSLVFVVVDGNIGQMMEPAELPPMRKPADAHPAWATTGAKGRQPNHLSSVYIIAKDEEVTNIRLLRRKMEIEKDEVRYKEYFMEDAEIAIVAFGTAGRVASTAVRAARQAGIKVGLLRPITLMPFPDKRLDEIVQKTKSILVVEMNTGMMLEDVKQVVNGRIPITFYGRLGGVTPFPEELLEEIQRIAANPPTSTNGNIRQEWLDRLEKRLAGGE